jgi:cytochrome c peroxidase
VDSLSKAFLIACICLPTLVSAGERDTDWTHQALRRMSNPPLGLPALGAQDMPSPEQIALGRKLFFDPGLSENASMSCATCHEPGEGFTQNARPTPLGSDGTGLRRNAPTLLNVGYARVFMHDGAEPSLRSQALAPLFNPLEMANTDFSGVIERVRKRADYRGLFEAAFGKPVTIPLIGTAIASYERSLLSANSAFDRWRYGGQSAALTDAAQRGFDLFTGKAGCSACHVVGDRWALFTDHSFHNTGVGYLAEQKRLAGQTQQALHDRGRQEVTFRREDLHKFKTPTLRNVALTAPYMHDGSLATLEDVVRYYRQGGSQDPNKDPAIRPLALSDEDVAALVAFLGSITGDNYAALAAEAQEGSRRH